MQLGDYMTGTQAAAELMEEGLNSAGRREEEALQFLYGARSV